MKNNPSASAGSSGQSAGSSNTYTTTISDAEHNSLLKDPVKFINNLKPYPFSAPTTLVHHQARRPALSGSGSPPQWSLVAIKHPDCSTGVMTAQV